MHITVIGTGYVGLVVGACLAETGNDVTCVDIDSSRIDRLRENDIPIYEPGLEDYVRRNQSENRLTFTTELPAAIGTAEVLLIAVGTPPNDDGSADLSAVFAVAEQIGKHLQREVVIATKSTVPVGTAARIADIIARHADYPFHVCSSPEFMKEGAAINDFMRPDRAVIGADSDHARTVMGELFAPFVRTGKPIIFMDPASAEMTKYASNGMLATRISFMNEIANLCERVGANVDLVRKGIGSDSRIGHAFLYPGPGYGGSCLPKDVKALTRFGRSSEAPLLVMEAVEEANERQKRVLFEKLSVLLGGTVSGARIAMWGLAFKARTDDLRESPAVHLAHQLIHGGATVVAHDPAAGELVRAMLSDIQVADSNYDAADGADALVIATEWNEYRHPDFNRLKSLLKRPIILDGRNMYDPRKIRALGFTYDSIGRGHMS